MKMDRLIGILSVLIQKDKVTSYELAEKFEVSRRTIIRDIETINQAGIPIVTSQGKGGGISVMDRFKIDKTLLSAKDMKDIFTGLKSLDSISQNNRYRQLMDKLSVEESEKVSIDGNIIIDLSKWDKSAVADKIELIKNSFESGTMISFRYFSPSGESFRKIEPYKLVFQWSGWYVWGYCSEREDFRMFKLTRMTDLKYTEEKCKIREIPPYTCDKLRHTKGSTETVVRFDKETKWRIIDEFGTEIPEFTESGDILITFQWSDTEALYRYVLTFSDKAEIISPKEHREEFLNLLEKIKNQYKI